ncbi:MAG: hypothetical protein VW268_05395 [Rhodospirillaceae bacterium]
MTRLLTCAFVSGMIALRAGFDAAAQQHDHIFDRLASEPVTVLDSGIKQL